MSCHQEISYTNVVDFRCRTVLLALSTPPPPHTPLKASSRRRRRLSLSEGVTFASSTITAPQSGSEGFKLNWPNSVGGGGQQARLSSSPPKNRRAQIFGTNIARQNNNSQVIRGAPRQGISVIINAEDKNVEKFGCRKAAPPLPREAEIGKEPTGVVSGCVGDDDGQGKVKPRQREGGAQEQKGCNRPCPLSPSMPQTSWRDNQTYGTLGEGSRRFQQVWEHGTKAGCGSSVYGGSNGRGGAAELPPCPVCFDRLDPAVSGVPSARVSAAARGMLGHGAHCNHKKCSGRNDETTTGQKPLGGFNGEFIRETGDQSEDQAGREEGTAMSFQGAEKKGPQWGQDGEEEARHKEGGISISGLQGGGGGGGRRALNVVMWKGSDCRVCRSLNVALEGAQDVVRGVGFDPLVTVLRATKKKDATKGPAVISNNVQ